jgi:Ecdysteroid kinase-like family
MSVSSNTFIDSSLTEILKNKFNSPDEYAIEFNEGSFKGDNHMGIIERIKIKSKVDNLVKSNIVLKTAPLNDERREKFLVRFYFLREVQFYTEIISIFNEFQKHKNVLVFTELPECYKAITEDKSEAIFLEDLTPQGFVLFDRFKPLTKDHVTVTLKTLAKFHAMSISMNDQQPELLRPYRSFQNSFVRLSTHEKAGLELHYQLLKTEIFKILQDEGASEKNMNRVNELLGDKKLHEIFQDIGIDKPIDSHGVLCHGDVSDLIVIILTYVFVSLFLLR